MIETQLKVAPRTTLLDALRDHLDLTGANKVAVLANAAPAHSAGGQTANRFLPRRAVVSDDAAFQCGYCRPRQICSAAGLVAEGKTKNMDEIRELMSRNICRCSVYPSLLAAIQQARGQS